MDRKDKGIDAETLNKIKHDIKNQLSNITLLLAQLKHEMQNAPEEQLEYLEMIEISITKVDAVLKSTG